MLEGRPPVARRNWMILWIIVGLVVALPCCIISAAVAIIVMAFRQQQPAPQASASGDWSAIAKALGITNNSGPAGPNLYEVAQSWTPEERRQHLEEYIFAPHEWPLADSTSLVFQTTRSQIRPDLVAILADPANRPRLATVLDTDPEETWRPRTCLGRAADLLQPPLPADLVPALMVFFADDSADVRADGAYALALVGTGEAIPGIQRALADADSRVVTKTVQGLGRLVYSALPEDADTRRQLFDAVLMVADNAELADEIPQVLIRLDTQRATDYYLTRDLIGGATGNEVRAITAAWVDVDARVPRDRLRELAVALSTGRHEWPATNTKGNAAYLLALHQNPDDLALLRHLAHMAALPGEEAEVSASEVARALVSHQGFHGAISNLSAVSDEELARQPDPVRQAAAVLALSDFVDEEYLEAYFENPDGLDWKDAQEGLRAIGARQHAAIFDQAVGLFGRAMPAANPEVRAQQLADIAASHPDAWDDLDAQWYDTTDSLQLLVAEFILRNPEAFAHYRADPWAPDGDPDPSAAPAVIAH